MCDHEHAGEWRESVRHLEEARRALTNPDDNALTWFRDCVDHNEYGLALDALSDVAEAQRAPRPVWERLLAAGAVMRLKESDAVHGHTLARINQHLTFKHEWFELRELLNEWDPIGIYDTDTDFPPDEYDCMYEPLMSRLRRGDSAVEIAAFLRTELQDHFGINPAPSRPEDFARRLVAWFATSAPSA